MYMLGRVLRSDEGDRVYKILALAWKNYGKYAPKQLQVGIGGSKLEQKCDYITCELSLSYFTLFYTTFRYWN